MVRESEGTIVKIESLLAKRARGAAGRGGTPRSAVAIVTFV